MENNQENIPPVIQLEPPKQNLFLKYKFLIFGILLLIVVGGGISWWNFTKKITSPSPELLDLVVPADWKTYRDELEGIEFKYPKEWFLGVIPSKGEALFEVRNFSQYAEGGVMPSNGTVFSFKKGCESSLNTDGYVMQDFGASYKELEKSFCKERFQVFLNVGMESSVQDKNILEMIPNSLIKIINTSTLKKYSNTEYAFEFQYPKEWDMRSQSQDVFKTDLIFQSKTNDTIEFIVTDGEFTPCEEDCVNNYNQNISDNNWTIYNLQYDGKNGKAAVLKKNNLRFVFSSSKSVDFNSSIFDGILTTFKFVNSQVSTTINIPNWKTYTNEKYGFELKYPKSFIKAKDLYNDKSYPDDRIIFSDEDSLTGSGAIQMLFSDKPLNTYCDNTGCKQRSLQIGNVKITIKYLEDATSVAEIPLSDGKYLQFMMGSVSPDAVDFFNKFLSTFRFISPQTNTSSPNSLPIITISSPVKNSVLKEGTNTTIRWNISNSPLDKSNWLVIGSVRCDPAECGKTGKNIFSYTLTENPWEINWKVVPPTDMTKFRGPDKNDYRNYGLDSKSIPSTIVVCLVNNQEVYAMGFSGSDGVYCSGDLSTTIMFDPPLSY